METIAGIAGAAGVLLFVVALYLLLAQYRIWHYSKQQAELLAEIRDRLVCATDAEVGQWRPLHVGARWDQTREDDSPEIRG